MKGGHRLPLPAPGTAGCHTHACDPKGRLFWFSACLQERPRVEAHGKELARGGGADCLCLWLPGILSCHTSPCLGFKRLLKFVSFLVSLAAALRPVCFRKHQVLGAAFLELLNPKWGRNSLTASWSQLLLDRKFLHNSFSRFTEIKQKPLLIIMETIKLNLKQQIQLLKLTQWKSFTVGKT